MKKIIFPTNNNIALYVTDSWFANSQGGFLKEFVEPRLIESKAELKFHRLDGAAKKFYDCLFVDNIPETCVLIQPTNTLVEMETGEIGRLFSSDWQTAVIQEKYFAPFNHNGPFTYWQEQDKPSSPVHIVYVDAHSAKVIGWVIPMVPTPLWLMKTLKG